MRRAAEQPCAMLMPRCNTHPRVLRAQRCRRRRLVCLLVPQQRRHQQPLRLVRRRLRRLGLRLHRRCQGGLALRGMLHQGGARGRVGRILRNTRNVSV